MYQHFVQVIWKHSLKSKEAVAYEWFLRLQIGNCLAGHKLCMFYLENMHPIDASEIVKMAGNAICIV